MIHFSPTIRTSARQNGYGNLLFADTHNTCADISIIVSYTITVL